MPFFTRAAAAPIVVAALLGWAYAALLRPPPTLLCGSPGGPPVTSPRIQLRDGRNLSYRQWGSSAAETKHNVVVVHGFDSSKHLHFPISQELVAELGIRFVSYDRPGYGESDPNPERSFKSDAMDIDELSVKLHLGPKFYLAGVSMGATTVWACLNYIPHRIEGAALVVPAAGFWLPSFPASLRAAALGRFPTQDRRTFWIARRAPALLYRWLTQRWLPSLSVLEQGNFALFSRHDRELLAKLPPSQSQSKARQQGIFYSLVQDLVLMVGDWGFDPMEMAEANPIGAGAVHVWQGGEDRFVPAELTRFLAEKLPWVEYHENPEGGHLFLQEDGWGDRIFAALLQPQKEGQQSSDH